MTSGTDILKEEQPTLAFRLRKLAGRSYSALALFAKISCGLTFFLIFMGGLVKSHEAGLSVPDWPTTYDENMFTFHPRNWVGGIFYEHTHRLVASILGLCTVFLTVWVVFAERRRFVWSIAIGAFVAVFLQGILGGLTVLMYLPPAVSIAHGVLAQLFFMALVALAYFLSAEGRNPRAPIQDSRKVLYWRATLLLTILIFVQLILGAVVRHTASGLAIPGFPLFHGEWIPWPSEAFLERVNDWRFFEDLDSVSRTQVVLHSLHRLTGYLIGGCVLGLFLYCRKLEGLKGLVANATLWLTGLLSLQILLGGITLWTLKAPLITSIHVVLGAGCLGVSLLLNLRAYPGERQGKESFSLLERQAA